MKKLILLLLLTPALLLAQGDQNSLPPGDLNEEIARMRQAIEYQNRRISSLERKIATLNRLLIEKLPDASAPAPAPAAASEEEVATVETTPETATSANIVVYTVQSGDTLTSISRAYSTNAAEIARLNEMEDPNKLVVGQKLILPAHNAAQAAAPESAPVQTADEEIQEVVPIEP